MQFCDNVIMEDSWFFVWTQKETFDVIYFFHDALVVDILEPRNLLLPILPDHLFTVITAGKTGSTCSLACQEFEVSQSPNPTWRPGREVNFLPATDRHMFKLTSHFQILAAFVSWLVPIFDPE